MIKLKETSHGSLGEGVQSFEVTGTPLPISLKPQERFNIYFLEQKINNIRGRADYLALITYMKGMTEEYSLVREISFDE
jgi:hypothetical protein